MGAEWRSDPATAKQRKRVKWWAAKLRVPAPHPRNKGDASDLIEQWEDEYPQIAEAWKIEVDRIHDDAEKREELEFQIDEAFSVADEWREFHNCKRVPKVVLKRVFSIVGPRRESEPINAFADRLFAEITKIRPDLVKSPNQAKKPSAQGCLVLALLITFLILILTTLLICKSPATLNSLSGQNGFPEKSLKSFCNSLFVTASTSTLTARGPP